MKPFRMRIIVAFLGLLVLGSTITLPERAHAQIATPGLPVFDAGNFIVNGLTSTATGLLSTAYQVRKGPGGSGLSLDTLGWTIGKIAIQMMTKSVVNWINSGFKGSPSFITNFSSFLTQVADVTAHSLISQIASNPAAKSPFQSQVAQSASAQYGLTSSQGGFLAQIQYTLGQVTGLGKDSAFLAGNFSQGGWTAWYSATQFTANNPIGAKMVANAQVNAQVLAAQGQHVTQAGWGQGFLSWCGDATGGGGGANEGGSCHTDDDCAGSLACVDPPEGHCAVDPTLDGTTAQTCTNKDGSMGSIQTPGSVIQAQLNKTLGIQGDTLVTADEFNEVIGALLSQLVSQVLGGVGLSGVSSSGYLAQATDPSQITNAQASSTQNATLITSITTELTAVQQYQTDLGTLLTTAQQAKVTGQACLIPPTVNIDQVISQIQAQQAEVTVAVSALQKIGADAEAAVAGAGTGLSIQSSGIQTITQVSTEFQTFLSSPTTPSNTDMSGAHTVAQTIQTGGTPTDNGQTGFIHDLIDYLIQLTTCQL